MAKKGAAKAPKPPKPKRREGEPKSEFRQRRRAWKHEQRIIKAFRKKGIEPDPAYLASLRGEVPPPPPPQERPIPVPKTREEGGQREDGSYIRRSAVDIDRIEAHLDTLMEKDRALSLKDRYKDMFDEDLDVPDGYELIPEREVRVRPGPPKLTDVEEPPLPVGTEEAGVEEVREELPVPATMAAVPPPVAPTPAVPPPPPVAPSPPPAPPEPIVEPEPEAEPEPEEEAPEPAPEVEAETPAEADVAPEAAPAAIEVTPGAVAGVAGAVPGAMAAAAGPVVEKRKPPRPVLHIWRWGKIGYWTLKEGGGLAKAVVFLINIPLNILLFIPGIPATIWYVYKGYKQKKADRERAAEEYYAQYGTYPQEGYPEGYGYGEQQEAYAYGAEGGYYEGEEYYDDRYGY